MATRERLGVPHAVRNGWVWVIALAVVGLAIGFGFALATPKVYQAEAQLYVEPNAATGGIELIPTGNTFVQARVQSLPSFATSPHVTTPVISNLHLRVTATELAAKIHADAPLSKTLINIRVNDGNAVQSARLTNAVAIQFIKVVEQVVQTSSGQPNVRLSVVHPAAVPTDALSNHWRLKASLGLLAGGAVALIGLALSAGGSGRRAHTRTLTTSEA